MKAVMCLQSPRAGRIGSLRFLPLIRLLAGSTPATLAFGLVLTFKPRQHVSRLRAPLVAAHASPRLHSFAPRSLTAKQNVATGQHPRDSKPRKVGSGQPTRRRKLLELPTRTGR